MCKQAERDAESKKLIVLMERVKRQIAEREKRGGTADVSQSSSASKDPAHLQLPGRSVPLER